MAAEDPLQGLREETACPICLEYFQDPVTTDCGHNFCKACIARYLGESGADAACPQCRETFQQGSLRPNRPLANMVELVKKLERGRGREARGGALCERHQEPVKLFCQDDQALICWVCDRSQEHRHHRALPIDEISQDYKEKIKAQQKSLEKERGHLLNLKLAEEDKSQKYLTQIEAEKQKIMSAFEQMHKFLEEQEHLRLSQLKGLEKEIGKRNKENIDRLSEEISRLSRLISEMDEKCKQPATEFLRDIQGTMNGYAKKQVGRALVLSPGLEERLRIYCQKNSALEKVMEKYKESLKQATMKVSLEEAWNQAKVTFDPNTGHPHLKLSKDQKSMWWDSREQFLPVNAERFDKEPCILGHESFTSGRHWWEVEVELARGRWEEWAVGVARESVRRKGLSSFSPEEGIWAVGKPFNDGFSPFQLLAFTSPELNPVTLNSYLKKIRVYLDCEAGNVAFFDVDSGNLIFTFPSNSFSGEAIQPFFWANCGLRLLH